MSKNYLSAQEKETMMLEIIKTTFKDKNYVRVWSRERRADMNKIGEEEKWKEGGDAERWAEKWQLQG